MPKEPQPEFTLKHKKPCKECPWRKDSLPGYLGGNPASVYASTHLQQQPIECHQKHGQGILCAGALVVYRNSGTLPRMKEIQDAVKSVSVSKDCFSHTGEFFQHHDNDANKRSIVA